MKTQSITITSNTRYEFNKVRIILICIIFLTISSNMFSQPQFLKRKYMKGFFVEKTAGIKINKTIQKESWSSHKYLPHYNTILPDTSKAYCSVLEDKPAFFIKPSSLNDSIIVKSNSSVFEDKPTGLIKPLISYKDTVIVSKRYLKKMVPYRVILGFWYYNYHFKKVAYMDTTENIYINRKGKILNEEQLFRERDLLWINERNIHGDTIMLNKKALKQWAYYDLKNRNSDVYIDKKGQIIRKKELYKKIDLLSHRRSNWESFYYVCGCIGFIGGLVLIFYLSYLFPVFGTIVGIILYIAIIVGICSLISRVFGFFDALFIPK